MLLACSVAMVVVGVVMMIAMCCHEMRKADASMLLQKLLLLLVVCVCWQVQRRHIYSRRQWQWLLLSGAEKQDREPGWCRVGRKKSKHLW